MIAQINKPLDLVVERGLIRHLRLNGGAVLRAVQGDVQPVPGGGAESRVHGTVPLHGEAGAGAPGMDSRKAKAIFNSSPWSWRARRSMSWLPEGMQISPFLPVFA